MSTSPVRSISAIAAAIVLAASASFAQADPAAKWRMQFENSTNNDGSITLRMAPEGGAPVDMEANMKKGSGAGFVATTLAGISVRFKKE